MKNLEMAGLDIYGLMLLQIFFDWDSPTYILYISVLVPVVRSSTKNTHHDKSCLSGPPDLDP